MKSDAFIISLAYPETIVRHPNEWYAKYMRFVGIGNKNYVRAGHAALVLINKSNGVLEYFDFGRYITPAGFGRLRSVETDHELVLDFKAEIESDKIININHILKFLATNPQFTHGTGHLYASVCREVNYAESRMYLNDLQDQGLVKYAAFIKDATNCARLVMDVLVAGCTIPSICNKLKNMQRFTPSTVGTVVNADTENYVYQVSELGEIKKYTGSVKLKNSKLFLDRLKNFNPSSEGSLKPKQISNIPENAQWLGGIGAGAWFVLYDKDEAGLYRFKRISSDGTIDTDSLYELNDEGFNIEEDFQFQYKSDCKTLHVKQGKLIFQFEFIKKSVKVSSMQMVHSA